MPLTKSFTLTEKIKILRFLGWRSDTISKESRYYSGFIDERLGADSAVIYDDAIIDEVRFLLSRIESIDDQLTAAPGRLKATSIGNEIRLNSDEIMQLRGERVSVIRELKVLVGFGSPNEYGFPSY